MKISDARKILDKTLADMNLLNFTDDLQGEHGLYWSVPTNAAFDMSVEPKGYEVGDINDEYNSVMSRLDSGDIIFPDSLLLLSSLFRLAYELSGDRAALDSE